MRSPARLPRQRMLSPMASAGGGEAFILQSLSVFWTSGARTPRSGNALLRLFSWCHTTWRNQPCRDDSVSASRVVPWAVIGGGCPQGNNYPHTRGIWGTSGKVPVCTLQVYHFRETVGSRGLQYRDTLLIGSTPHQFSLNQHEPLQQFVSAPKQRLMR